MNLNHFDEPHISFSQINCYMNCPLKYRFQYIDQLEADFVPSAIPFGSSLHEALAFFYRGLRDYKSRYSLDALIDIFKCDWELRNQSEPVRYDHGDTKDRMTNLAISMLKAFYENVTPGEVIVVEQPFCLRKMDNNGDKPLPLPLVGTIDLVERDKDGKIWAVDHKSASRKYSESKIEDDLQLTIYTCAVARSKLANGDKEFNARFDVLTKTKTPEFVTCPTTRVENDHRRLMKILREILTAIENGVFYPIPGWMCGSCQYSNACSNW
jgi:putative RecB family exonuclease